MNSAIGGLVAPGAIVGGPTAAPMNPVPLRGPALLWATFPTSDLSGGPASRRDWRALVYPASVPQTAVTARDDPLREQPARMPPDLPDAK